MTARDASIVMYTTTWCGDCRQAKRVCAALGVSYTEVNIERQPQASELVRQLNGGMQSVPTMVFPDGSRLVEPSYHALETHLRSYVAQRK